MDEAQELAEADAPEEMSEESSDAVDLGLDPGDLDIGTGGGFVMEIPKFGIGGGRGGRPFESGELDTPPQPVSKSQPIYPNRLLSKGVGGRVVVEVGVDPTGKVTAAKIRTGSGNRELDEAALKAVRKWRFRPAVKNGKKARATVLVPFDFEVKR
jgi:TonB family protein